MRFKEFLTERAISNFDDVVRQIRSNCAPFLKHGRMLYRGIPAYSVKGDKVDKLDFDKAHYTPHPTGRKAKHSNPAFNFMFNAGVELAFGEDDVREHTIFATNDPHLAKQFGEVMFFFPAGEFKFLASQTVEDSYENSEDLYNAISSHLTHIMGKAKLRVGFDALRDHFKNESLWIKDSKKAFAVTKECFGVDDDQFYFQLKDALKAAFQELYYDTPNLGHFDLKGEILFYHTHGYYTIPATVVMKEMEARGIEHVRIPEDEEIKKFLRDYIAGKHDAV